MAIKRTFFRDILRDTNSKKFSMTKFAAFTTIWLLVAAVVTGIVIMIIEKEVDHILIGELIALLLTLLGFKNFKNNFRTPGTPPNEVPVEVQVIDNEESDIVVTKEDKDEIG